MITAIGEKSVLGKIKQNSRSKAPVFVLGCPRSGTTVLYHMLLSAGGFAIYRAESNVFNLLAPRFGNLNSAHNRQRLLKTWLRSKLFKVAGLNEGEISGKILSECRNAGDFLRILMEEIASHQGVERWADTTPDHLLYMREIKRQIPEALFIHIVRDGRDVALSFARQGWSHPLPGDRNQELSVAALYWAWVVRRGRELGRELAADYLEIRFEDLVSRPREVLAQVGRFVEHDLDYDRIQDSGIGSVRTPNSSFANGSEREFNPVGRWKNKLSPQQLLALESLVGDVLLELGYPLANNSSQSTKTFRARRMRALYPRLFALKIWLKNHTLLGRFADTAPMEIEGEYPAPE
jgi:hypothetical protein